MQKTPSQVVDDLSKQVAVLFNNGLPTTKESIAAMKFDERTEFIGKADTLAAMLKQLQVAVRGPADVAAQLNADKLTEESRLGNQTKLEFHPSTVKTSELPKMKRKLFRYDVVDKSQDSGIRTVIVFVSDGLGGAWATYYFKDGRESMKRVVSKNLPVRNSRAAATEDLVKYAKDAGLELAGEVDLARLEGQLHPKEGKNDAKAKS